MQARREGSAEDPVVIVGAGPIGMTAALALARHEVPSVVLDASQGLSGEGSKAICVQRDVLDALDRLGCGTAMATEGVSWTLGRTYFRSRELFQTRLPESGSAFPPFVNLPQSRTEELLLGCLRADARIDLRWRHQVTGLAQDGQGVTLDVDTPEGPVRLRASFVLACDGGRSAVRRLLGVDFPGHSHADRFLIADIRADLPFPDERRFFFDPPFNPGRTVLIHPQPHKVWRIDWQVPPDTDAEEERRSGRLDERIRAIVGDATYELVWVSSYRFHQRVASRFRVGRVLLAGDAAHLMSPFGARGMNSGVQDAENAAWKLALVRSGLAPDRLLDSYHDERWAAATENVQVTDATMRFMVPPGRGRRAVRNAILRASVASSRVRRMVNSGRLAEPFDYRNSPIVVRPATGEGPTGPHPGRLAPDAWLRLPAADPVPGAGADPAAPARPGRPTAGAARLRALVGPAFLLLAFPTTVEDGVAVAAAARAATDLPLRVVLVAAQPAAPPGGSGAGDVLVVADHRGELAARYPAPGQGYLIRPDGHVTAGPLDLDPGRLARTLDHCTARTPLTVPAAGAAA